MTEQVDYDELEEALARETSLEPFEISRVVMMTRQRFDKGWSDPEYVLHSALNDSGVDKSEIDSFLTAFLGE